MAATKEIETFFEFELAEDTKEFALASKDVVFSPANLKEKLFSYDSSVLLKVTKEINSPTKILAIEQVDKKYIEENF